MEVWAYFEVEQMANWEIPNTNKWEFTLIVCASIKVKWAWGIMHKYYPEMTVGEVLEIMTFLLQDSRVLRI